ncbi:MAG: MBL fold metallo-hydrolase [Eubacteriales bacterium]|nr:MBL fold metallo-hydrolase [Eubacteriales bacterium]
MIQIKSVSVGTLGTNCYVVTDKYSGETAVVDPGGVNARLMTILKEIGEENIKYILLTHGHFDHTAGVNAILEDFSPQVVICEKEEPFLSDVNLNLADILGCMSFEPIYADITLCEGDSLYLGETEFKLMETPGHTTGSACFIFPEDRVIFSGDTLFYQSMGRTDFPTGSHLDMMKSLKRLKNLSGDYKVYPGHNESTTLEYERISNLYMS